jgi:phosphoglycolate phosphatase/putative hydrolase of the HAD superfamily
MKVYKLPPEIQVLAFDMDLTLYSNREYGQYQVDCLVKKLGQSMGLSFEEMNIRIEYLRKAWPETHNGKKPSHSDLIGSYGIGMEANIRWREELFEPALFIGKDLRLSETLGKLKGRYILGLITNNPLVTARKTLAALGVENCFSILVGLDTCMKSKPAKEPFLKFLEFSQCPSETCVSIGDRYDIDLDTPLSLGMGAILVDGVEDVYRLPELLTHNKY